MKHNTPMPFEVAEQVRQLGTRIRIARIRRQMDRGEMARKSHIARSTLQRIEAGNPACEIGSVYTVLWTLGLLPTASQTADPDSDEHGKTLEAARQGRRVRQPRAASDENDF